MINYSGKYQAGLRERNELTTWDKIRWRKTEYPNYPNDCLQRTRNVQKQVSRLHNFCVNGVFCSSAGGSTCSRSNMPQMAQESVRCHAWDKLMCNGNDNYPKRKFVKWIASYGRNMLLPPTEIQGKLVEVYTYGNGVRRVHKSENGADSSEMVKQTCMMSAPTDSAHQGRVRMRHEWRKWVWKTNESKFEVHLLHWNCTSF